MTEGERNEPTLADEDGGGSTPSNNDSDLSGNNEAAPDETMADEVSPGEGDTPASEAGDGGVTQPSDGETSAGELAVASTGSEIAGWLTGDLSKPRLGVPESGRSGSLTPQVLPPDVLDEEDLSVLPGVGGATWLGLRRRTWAGATGAVVVLLLAFVFLRAGDPPEAANKGRSSEAAPGSKLDALVPAPADPSGDTPSADTDSHGASRNRSLPLIPGLEADPEDPSTFMGPRGPSVARFPDLPREVLVELEKAAKAKKKGEPYEAAAPADAPPPASPAPPVQTPISPAPTLQAPVMPAPTVPAPIVAAPTVPAPTVPAPTVQAPVAPAPTVRAPVLQ